MVTDTYEKLRLQLSLRGSSKDRNGTIPNSAKKYELGVIQRTRIADAFGQLSEIHLFLEHNLKTLL